jgi:hypothetical protein
MANVLGKTEITKEDRKRMLAEIKGANESQNSAKESKEMEENKSTVAAPEKTEKSYSPLELAERELLVAQEELEGLKSPADIRKALELGGVPTEQIDAIVNAGATSYKEVVTKVQFAQNKVELYKVLTPSWESIKVHLEGTRCEVVFSASGFLVRNERQSTRKQSSAKGGKGRGMDWFVGDKVYKTGTQLLEDYPAREEEVVWWTSSKDGQRRPANSATAAKVQKRLAEEQGLSVGRC